MTLDSPLRIKILLHYHVSPEPWPGPCRPDVEILEFLAAGVIEHSGDSDPGSFKTTPLGQAWVAALCNVPLPRTVFVDELDRIIKA